MNATVMDKDLLIDGKSISADVRQRIARHVSELKVQGIIPGLAVVLVGEDPASQIYVRNKRTQTLEAGMNSYEHKLPADTPQKALTELIGRLNADPAVHGILVQLPLPGHLNAEAVINAIDPAKDVDGFQIPQCRIARDGAEGHGPMHAVGMPDDAARAVGQPVRIERGGRRRSNIVGKPMAQLLVRDSCTVTIAHSRTRNLPELCRAADILVVAAG